MKKGVYTATIALAVLILSIALIANTARDVSVEEGKAYKDTIVGVKAEWINLREVLDRAVTQGIADDIIANECGYLDAPGKINGYFYSIVTEMFEGDCSYTSLEVNENNKNVAVNVVIGCEKSFGDKFNVSYEKTVLFEKTFSATGPSPCSINIIDKQSGNLEYTQ